MDYRESYDFRDTYEEGRDKIKEYLPDECWYERKLDLYSFPQTWGTTSLGWGGISGQAFTTAQTVIIFDQENSIACVYIGGRFAYMIRNSKEFFDTIRNQRIVGVSSVLYKFGDDVIEVNKRK